MTEPSRHDKSQQAITDEPSALDQAIQTTDVSLRSIWANEDQHYETYDGRKCAYSLAMLDAVLGRSFAEAPQGEKAAFLAYCMHQRLDPIRKQVHFVKYQQHEPASFIASWEVFLDRAQRHPQFDGFQSGIVWEVIDGGKTRRKRGKPCDYDVDAMHKIAGGWAIVWRKDRDVPREIEVPIAEMQSTKRDGSPVKMWRTAPTTMAQKTAIARALRQSFSEDLSGIYTEDESDRFRQDTITNGLRSGDTLPPGDLDALAKKISGEEDAQKDSTD